MERIVFGNKDFLFFEKCISSDIYRKCLLLQYSWQILSVRLKIRTQKCIIVENTVLDFIPTYGGQEPRRNRVVTPARQAKQAGGIDSLESIPWLLKSFKIPSLYCTCSLSWPLKTKFSQVSPLSGVSGIKTQRPARLHVGSSMAGRYSALLQSANSAERAQLAKLRLNRPALAWLVTDGNLSEGGLGWLIGVGFKKDSMIILLLH